MSSMRRDIQLRLLGVDIATRAIRLAKSNLKRVSHDNRHVNRRSIEFMRADVLIDPFGDQTLRPPSLKAALNWHCKPPFWDILISNPPYISLSTYWKTTTRSVRGFEPKLALVPPSQDQILDVEQGDAFYPRLLAIARDVEAKVVLLEVADLDQALRVARMARAIGVFQGIEIWRDQPDQANDLEESVTDVLHDFPIIGAGNGRSVLCWRNAGAAWLGKSRQSSIT